ncbi:MAG: SMC family ATPase [Candidatus Bathyarchaeia archaeon]
MLRSLEIRGFEGYREARIEFSPGLNLITGRNSSGKTTILEAILTALYGEVPGVQKRLLVSRLQDTARRLSVKLSLRTPDNREMEVEREGRTMRRGEEEGFRTERLRLTINGEEAHLEGEEDLRRRITELTGLSMKKFLNLVYVRQGELTDILEPKREDMDSILGISLMKELEAQLTDLERELERYEGRDAKTLLEAYRVGDLPRLEGYIKTLEAQINPLKNEVEQLENLLSRAESEELRGLLETLRAREEYMEEHREAELHLKRTLEEWKSGSPTELERMLEEATGRLTRTEIEARRLAGEVERLRRTRDSLEGRLQRIRYILQVAGASTPEELDELIGLEKAWEQELMNSIRELEVRLASIEERRNELSGRKSALEEEIRNHEELLMKGAPECPTCGQRITPELLLRLIEDKGEMQRELEIELKEVMREHLDLRSRLEGLRKDSNETAARVKQLQGFQSELKIHLEGASEKELSETLTNMNENLVKLESSHLEKSKELAVLQENLKNLKGTVSRVKQLEERKRELQLNIENATEKISEYLKRLILPIDPKDPELKEKIAAKLPISIEEMEEKRIELEEKKNRLEKLVKDYDKHKKDKKEIEEKVEAIERRLERAKTTSEMVQKLRMGIEEGRRRALREVAGEALRIYNSLTDQRIYKAFKIDPESYQAQVQPTGLEEYIPAKRVGGGHQTLIALSLRIALLNVLGHRNLLILDEPTYGVDSENLPQLMSQISEASKRIPQVLLVTHHGAGEEEAANIIRVSRNPDGSSKAERLSLH